jgi:hypothetical protein
MSSQHPIGTESARSYARAYAMHYSQHDFLAALTAYADVVEHHPTSPEAGYSRAQMHNIVRSVIPASTLLASQVQLARTQLERTNDISSTSDGSPHGATE